MSQGSMPANIASSKPGEASPSKKKGNFSKQKRYKRTVVAKTNGKKEESAPPSSGQPERRGNPGGSGRHKRGTGSKPANGKKAKPQGHNNNQDSAATESEVKPKKPVPTSIKTFTRSWIIDEKLAPILEQRFPNHKFVTKGATLTHHPHTLCAIERAITEENIYEALKKMGCEKITDVGGNATRHVRRKEVHSCCPVLTPKDVMRNTRYDSTMNYCTDRAEECKIPADGYMAIHSLYYLEPETVLSLLFQSKKKVFMASVHDFSQGYGSMHFNGTTHESTYQIVNKKLVLMTSLGNDGEPYNHAPCFWLARNYFEFGGKAMAWGYREVGDTRIYKFVPAPLGLLPSKQHSMDLVSTIKNEAYTGEVESSAYAPLMNYLNIETVEFKSFGPLIWVNKKEREMYIPKGLIQRVAFNLVGKPRTKDTLKLCIRDTRKELSSKNLKLPAALSTELAFIVPPLAFLIHLEDEIESFNQLLLPTNQRLFNSLNDALNLVSPAVGCFKYIACCTRTRHYESTIIVDEYNSDRTSVQIAREKIGRGMKFLSTTATTAMKKIRPGAYVKVVEEKEPREDTPLMGVVATTFTGHIPVVPTSTQQNTLLSIRNRVVADVDPPVDGHWEKMSRRFIKKQYINFAKFMIKDDVEQAFTEWNNNFPPGRKKEHLRAFEFLKSNSMQVHNYYRKLFGKREKLDKSTPDGLVDFVQRAISGTSHEANVLLGPFMYQYSKELTKQWDGRGVFYYTAGATAYETGSWMHDNYRLGDLLVEIDFTQYDSTQGKDSHKFESNHYQQAGIDKYTGASDVVKKQTHMRGFTGDGIEYFVPYGRNSGDPNTSVGNTTNTCSTTEYVMTEVFGEGDFKIKGMGDDNITIIPAALANGRDLDEVRDQIVAEFAKFGFKAKVKLHTDVSRAEFCSAAYWPAKVDGEETFVMGPKPGRLLTKMGFTIKDLSLGEVKGMFQGYQASCGHVPVLRVYVNQMLAKMDGIRATHYYDKEARYKMQAVAGISESDELGEFFMARYGLDLQQTEQSLSDLLDNVDLDDMVEWPLLEVLRCIDA